MRSTSIYARCVSVVVASWRATRRWRTVLEEGNARANNIADRTLQRVREIMGMTH